MRAFRLLTEPEIECRIAEISKQGTGLSLLLYKTARTDAALLDETYGADRWQNDFKMLDGKLYGGIGIKFGDEWIWRWDCGTESNMEAEKGQASDAFKRAGFKWGLGAELYTAPRIWIPAEKCQIREYNGKYRCYDTFAVSKIGYSPTGVITELNINNVDSGKTVYEMQNTALVGKTNTIYYCDQCGAVISPYRTETGNVSATRHAESSKNKFGRVLCLNCIKEQYERPSK